MSFSPPPAPPTPQATTVARYTVERLGRFPSLRADYSPTNPAEYSVAVTSMVADGETFTALVGSITAPEGAEFQGAQVKNSSGDVVATLASVEDARTRFVFAEAISTDLTGTTVTVVLVNAMGVPLMLPVGRAYGTLLGSENPTHLAYMQTLMGGITVQIVMEALAIIGASKTLPEITTQDVIGAVQAMPDNLESLLASGLEQMEQDRRNGDITLPVIG